MRGAPSLAHINPLWTRRSPLVAALGVTIGLAACGGGESDSSGGTEAAGSGGPGLETVLSCLQDAGLEAQDQSSNTSGETIGIDYPAGRTVISFEKSEEDAETAESVQPDPTAETFREGLIVVSIPGSPDATAGREAIETCIAG